LVSERPTPGADPQEIIALKQTFAACGKLERHMESRRIAWSAQVSLGNSIRLIRRFRRLLDRDMAFRFVPTLLLLLSTLSVQADEAPIAGYSAEPLRAPLFDEAQVAVETTAINNWLIANIKSLTYEQMKGPREYLYYLIDSRVKQHYATEKQVLPTKHDLILEMLFSWAEPLGVFGGSQAFNAVKDPASAGQDPTLKLPAGISLSLVKDLFTIHSASGWTVSFPYYFMIGRVREFTATSGSRTQLVIVSTGAAKDKSKAGKSQATIMLMFSPEKYESFEKYWREQYGIGPEVTPKALGVANLSSRHVVDAPMMLHK
jgi:hypothetical protein